GVPQEKIDLRGSIEDRIYLHVFLVIQSDVRKCNLAQLSHAVRFSSCNHVISRLGLLQHQMDGFHIVRGMSPIASRIQVAEMNFLRQAELNFRNGAANLSGHEFESSTRSLMVKQDAVAAKHSVCLAVVCR